MSFLRYLRDLFRELSDESAYKRHLRRAGVPHSSTEWKRFSDDRHRAKYSRAKCC